MNNIRIRDLNSLQREKDRLRLMVDLKEKELKLSGIYLKQNYKSILWKSVNPFEGKSTFGEIVDIAKNAILPGVATITIDDLKAGKFNSIPLAGVAAGLISMVVRKIINKRKERKEAKKDGE